MPQQPQHFYEFGPFRIDVIRRLLHRNGEVVPLTPKTFEVLLALIESPGETVEKDELMRRIWPDSFVEEVNLAYHISLLRKALGERRNEHNYILTISGRGYRFLAAVKEPQPESAGLISHRNEIAAESDIGSAFSESKVLDGQNADQGAVVEVNSECPVPPDGHNLQVIEAGEKMASVGVDSTVGATPSSESLISWITRRKRWVTLAVAALLIGIGVLTSSVNRKPALTEADSIILEDFVNATGETIFDGMLKQALAIQLEQSPFLKIFPDDRVRETLRYMNRPPENPVTGEVTREICERQGIKAFLASSIAPMGNHYVITLEARNGHTGEVLARQQLEAENKEQVLRTLSVAATKVRQKLGESLRSIRKFDASEDQATTSSLAAFKAYLLGDAQQITNPLQAIGLFERAVELDPKFAMAYRRLAYCYFRVGKKKLGVEFAKKAFELREQVSERERLSITQSYYFNVEGDLDKAGEVLEVFKQMYPTNFVPYHNLVAIDLDRRQYNEALEDARQSFRLAPRSSLTYEPLALALIQSNRFKDAVEVIKEAEALKSDNLFMHQSLYQIAFVQGNAEAMKQQIDWATEKQNEYQARAWQAGAAAFKGQARRARELANGAISSAQHRESAERASVFAAEAAQREAVFGNCQQTRREATRALTLAHDLEPTTRSASALALCGEASQAQSLLDELTKQSPKDTLINLVWLPIVHAQIEIQRGHPAQAIQSLESDRYEGAGGFWFPYLRGQAYLQEHRGAEAAAQFQKILDHWGWDPLSTLYPLARLGLARAAALTGDTDQSHKAYQDFLILWKDADAVLPILKAAKQEYTRVPR